ncbi:hypothetical protein GQR58_005644 [Nymphon striatum]|nr:hypothetical protein GQR58_005644 [Nymphon striatum]
MKTVQSVMSEDDYARFTTHFPFIIPICKSIEQFTNINCTSSYQHRDLNAGSESKDKRDHETFLHVKGTMDNEAIVVFDGYECTTSTKSAEQKRRATKSSSRDIMFDESMQTVTTQSAFSMIQNKFYCIPYPNKCVCSHQNCEATLIFGRHLGFWKELHWDSRGFWGHGTTRVPSGKVGLNDYSYLKTQCKYCNNSIQVMKLELSIIIVKSKGPVTLIQDQWELGRTSRKGNILKFVPHSGWKLRLA